MKLNNKRNLFKNQLIKLKKLSRNINKQNLLRKIMFLKKKNRLKLELYLIQKINFNQIWIH